MRKKSCGYLHQARYNFARTQPRSNSEHQPRSNSEHKPRSNSEHQLRSNSKHHLTRPKFARNNNSLTEILTKHKAQSTKHKAQSTKHKAQSTKHKAQRTKNVQKRPKTIWQSRSHDSLRSNSKVMNRFAPIAKSNPEVQ
jgi:hypothetical protein